MAILCNVKVLKLRLKVDPSVLYGNAIFLDIGLNLRILLWSRIKVLSSSCKSVLPGNWLHRSIRVFIDTLLGECSVNSGTEVRIKEHSVGSILAC